MRQTKKKIGFSPVPPLIPAVAPPPPPIPSPPQFSREDSFKYAHEYLKAIAPDDSIFDFRVHYKAGGVSKVRGTLQDKYDYLFNENNKGAAIYVTINETDGKGVKNNNIVRVRSIFLDFDNQKDGILDVIKNMPLKPSLIVNTSKGNYHVFWRIIDCPLDRFKEIQSLLIEKYCSDIAVNDLARVMRIAGFKNTKREHDYPCRIIESTNTQYSMSEVISTFGLFNSGNANTDKTDKVNPTVSFVSNVNVGSGNSSAQNRAEWITNIIKGENLHGSSLKLLMSNISRLKMTESEAIEDVGAIMRKGDAIWTERGKERFNDLSRMAKSCIEELNPFSVDFYDWPNVIPIEPVLKPVEGLTYDYLPNLFSKFAEDVSERMQCPADFSVVGLFISFASVIGNKVRIYPWQKGNWSVVPNLWGVIIGRPSLMKTPSLKGALDILKRFEIEEKDIHENALIEYGTEEEFRGWTKKSEEKRAKEFHEQGDIKSAKSIMNSLKTDSNVPTRVRHIINDATVEKLGELLNENPNGFLMFRDELTGWLNQLDKEGSNDRPFYLEAWDGCGTYVVDRIGRGTIDIESTTLSLLGGIQPNKLKSYIYAAMNNSTSDDGLIQRLQLAVYPNVRKEFKLVDRYPDKSVKQPLLDKFRQLKEWQPISTTKNDFDEDEPFFVRFNSEAQKCFNEWYIKNEKTCRSDLHPALESHFAKYRSLLPSLALIIELVDSPEVNSIEKVSLSSLQKAIGYVEYLRSHAYRIYGMAEKPEVDGANLIINRLKKLENPFTARDIQRKGWSGLTDTSIVQKSLMLLEEHNYCRKHIINSVKGGTAKVQYHVNPLIFTKT